MFAFIFTSNLQNSVSTWMVPHVDTRFTRSWPANISLRCLMLFWCVHNFLQTLGITVFWIWTSLVSLVLCEMKVMAVTHMIMTFQIIWFNKFWPLIKYTSKCFCHSWLSSFTSIEFWVLVTYNAAFNSCLKKKQKNNNFSSFTFAFLEEQMH